MRLVAVVESVVAVVIVVGGVGSDILWFIRAFGFGFFLWDRNRDLAVSSRTIVAFSQHVMLSFIHILGDMQIETASASG